MSVKIDKAYHPIYMQPTPNDEARPLLPFGKGDQQNSNWLFFKAITENNSDGIVLMNGDGSIIYQSASSERISGYNLQEIQSKNFIEFVHEDDQTALVAMFTESLSKTGIALNRTVKIKHKNDGYRYIQGSMTNLLGVPGVNAIVVTYQDVTKQRETEMQLQKSVADLQTVFASTDDAIVFVDTQYTISAFNNRAADIVEREANMQIAVGTNCLNYTRPERRDILKGMLDAVFRGQDIRHEVNYPKADGTSTWYYIRLIRAYDDKLKQALGLTISVSDITKLKQAEVALKKSEANLSAIFNHATDGIILVDTDYKLISFNQRAFDITKRDLKKEAKIGISCLDYFGTERREFIKSAIDKVMTGSNISYETSYLQPDGSLTWYFVRMVSVQDNANGNTLGVMMTLIDITTRKEYEQAIQAMNGQLEAKVEERTASLQLLNKQLEAFTYSVSHDLKMPAYIVHNMAGLLLKKYHDKLGNEGQELVDEILKYSSHMEKLIKDLLLLSKSTTTQVYKQKCNMRKAVYDAITENMDTGLYRHAEVQVGEVLEACCDGDMIKLVWLNLVSNALKYSAKHQKPFVEIGSKREAEHIVFYVRDNGIGFDMQHADKLFEVFQRLHGIDDYEGSGVGLALVKRIIERHQGKVWVESQPNGGTTFYFSLPSVENCGN